MAGNWPEIGRKVNKEFIYLYPIYLISPSLTVDLLPSKSPFLSPCIGLHSTSGRITQWVLQRWHSLAMWLARESKRFGIKLEKQREQGYQRRYEAWHSMDIRPAGKMVSNTMPPFNTSSQSLHRWLTLLQSLQPIAVLRQWLVQLACANSGVPVLLDYSTHRRDWHLTSNSRKLRSSERWKRLTRR